MNKNVDAPPAGTDGSYFSADPDGFLFCFVGDTSGAGVLFTFIFVLTDRAREG